MEKGWKDSQDLDSRNQIDTNHNINAVFASEMVSSPQLFVEGQK